MDQKNCSRTGSFNRLSKAALIFLLAVSLLIPSAAVYASAPDIPDADMRFTDIYPKNWAYDSIFNMFALGIMSGVSDTKFAPKTNMTRAMFIQSLAKLDKVDLSAYGGNDFNDVPADAYYDKAVTWAVSEGITGGTGNGCFSPDGVLTREQLVTMLYKYCESKGLDVSNIDWTLTTLFYDDYKIAPYAQTAFYWAVNYGIISGVSAACASPKGSVTREQAACMLWKLLCYDPDSPLPKPEKIHLVRFMNYDGSQIFAMRVADGGTAVYPFPIPTRPTYEYTAFQFIGWDKPLSPITGDTVFTAQFRMYELPTCTVRFLNYDGTVLQKTRYLTGSDAYYVGKTPAKSSDKFYNYNFIGWDRSEKNIQTDTDIYAVFKPVTRYNMSGDIRYDYFVKDMINVNGSSFRLSSDLYGSLMRCAGERPLGFYLVDLGTGTSVGYNADYKFHTASTVKLGLAYAAFREIEKGNLKLGDVMTYQEKYYVGRSGVIQNTPYGTKYTFETLLHYMIYESDNVAYYMAHDHVGCSTYNKYMQQLGVSNRHYSYKSFQYLTPQELGLEWRAVYNYRNACWEGSRLWSELVAAKYNFIKQGLNYKYRTVAHKSGFNDMGYHDSAVIMGDRPFIMVIMTEPPFADDQQAYLAKVAKLLDKVEGEYYTWLCSHER
ncbi:MAG: serine hydrolase [Clostridia bacterium]|nr:serine hydrolase [Clostridia bacterium]